MILPSRQSSGVKVEGLLQNKEYIGSFKKRNKNPVKENSMIERVFSLNSMYESRKNHLLRHKFVIQEHCH